MIEIIKRIKYIEDFNKDIIDILEESQAGIEIQDFTEPNLLDSDKSKIMGIYKNGLKEFKNTISMHGPFLDLRPGSPDGLVREVSQKRYIEVLEYAKELNAGYVIFHSQINPRMNKKIISDWTNQQNKEAFEFILEKSQYKGIIVIENIFETHPEMLLEMIKWIDNEQIAINLDIGHVRLSDASLEEWISSLKDYIMYVHVHSNDGVYDNHIPPSKEEIDELYSLLNKYDISPKICLEYDVEDLKEELERYIR